MNHTVSTEIAFAMTTVGSDESPDQTQPEPLLYQISERLTLGVVFKSQAM